MATENRVLIANRGEIAIRVARAASALDMESVAVFAPADALALHVRAATTAVPIGASAAASADPVAAYLDVSDVIAAAVDTGCHFLHPGYGFLSESPALAEACAAAGITFVGPSAGALRLFGDKVQARALAQSIGIPVLPGSTEPLGSVAAAAAFADRLGYPIMLKAAAGGGGRGMRSLSRPDEMAEAFERCRSEAQAAFGDGSVFMEKLVARPRHIEVQVLADSRGAIVHLHDRDCSVQLRNQKVVEIAPAPNLDSGLRAQMYSDAVSLVRAVGYNGAGTVEFLVVPESNAYFFIEHARRRLHAHFREMAAPQVSWQPPPKPIEPPISDPAEYYALVK